VKPLRTAKLFNRDGRLVKELDIPQELDGMPDVIFYQALAFHCVLAHRGEYTECSCWRAPEENQAKVEA